MKIAFGSGIVSFLVVALAGYVLVTAFVFVTQRSLLYHPSHDGESGALKPWIVRGTTMGYARPLANPASIWLMAHGNAGEAANRDYILQCVSADSAVYVVEYPGYGLRSGSPSEASLNRAVREAYDELLALYPNKAIGVIGESLGSGPACTLAQAPVPPARFVLIVPFATLASVASEHMPFLPIKLLLKDRWDNVASLQGYRGPITVYAARQDNIIGPEHGRRLATAVGATFHLIDSGHNDLLSAGAVRFE
jgi:pimeloyl-ACP methyl ester carboxylesterase